MYQDRKTINELIPELGLVNEFSGLSLSGSAFILAEMLKSSGGTYLVYLPTSLETDDFLRDIAFFWPEGKKAGAIQHLSAYDSRPFTLESPSPELVFDRLEALYSLRTERNPLVVACSAPAALKLNLPPSVLSASVELLIKGEEIDREGLLEFLRRTGYNATPMVQGPGDYSVRGGILDIYPPGQSRPVRAEFFGDEVESLRTFRTIDQRSVDELEELTILPASEIIHGSSINNSHDGDQDQNKAYGSSEKALFAFRELVDKNGWPGGVSVPIEEEMGMDAYFSGIESFLPLYYDRLYSLEEFASEETVRFVFDPVRFRVSASEYYEKLREDQAKAKEKENPHLPVQDLYRTPEEIIRAQEKRRMVGVKELPVIDPDFSGIRTDFHLENTRDLRIKLDNTGEGQGMLAPLAARVKSWLDRGLEINLSCHTEEQAKRISGLLAGYGLNPSLAFGRENQEDLDTGSRFRLVKGFLSSGFVMDSFGKAYITEDELFGTRQRLSRRSAEEVKGVHLSSFQDLQVGDHVVHRDHGICQYMGLVKLEAGGISNDFLLLTFKGDDRLYVPVDRFSDVQKYIGANTGNPRLDKLGGEAWAKVKKSIKKAIRDMAKELIDLYARRQMKKGHSFAFSDSIFQEFEAAFEFEETPDQAEAINQVLLDMESEKTMDRLVCGDVGFGKTEVAMRAAYKAVLDGKQVAILVPTTVLAEQHYLSFCERFSNLPVNVDVLSRFKSRKEQKETLERLAMNQVDIIIGTHRLLSKDIVFVDLGLLIIDEEHRFGVAQKEKIKKMKLSVDVLALSATPIPRSLQMSLNNIRDLSVISTPPRERRAIKSVLIKYDETSITEAIALELSRGGQVFFVHNRVKDIDNLAARLRKLMPLVRFGVAHGQQKERDLENVMMSFLKGRIDVLVTTTIIESGLDIPTANTIIINNADHFGMAQIYQLRGRVGRSNVQAYAYLLVKSEDTLTRNAKKRLRALMDLNDLGSGFKVALHDLQIRGGGNLIGAAQSGQIKAVGYEMYVQLIEQTVKELKGEPLSDEIEPEIMVDLRAFIPETYVPDTEQRLIHYRRFSAVSSEDELYSFKEELKDRYGALPEEVENLAHIIEMKQLAVKARIIKLEIGKSGMTLTFNDEERGDTEKIFSLAQSNSGQNKLYPDGRLFLPLNEPSGREGLKKARKVLQEFC